MVTTNGLLINPSPTELKNIQSYAYKSNSPESLNQMVKSVGNLLDSIQGGDPTDNTPRYVNGFNITYSDTPTQDTGNLPLEYSQNIDYQYFIIEGGTVIIDSQIITFNEPHLQIRVSTPLSTSHPLKSEELDPNEDYVITVKYVNNNELTTDVADIHIVTTTEFNQEAYADNFLKIGTFKTDEDRKVYSSYNPLSTYQYSVLDESEKTNYKNVNGQYFTKGIDSQNLQDLIYKNYEPLFEQLSTYLLTIMSDNNLSSVDFEEIDQELINEYVPSGSFITFNKLTGLYDQVFNISDDIKGFYLKKLDSKKGIIAYNGALVLDEDKYIIPSSLKNLDYGTKYYLNPQLQQITPIDSVDTISIGYYLPGITWNKLLMNLTNNESKDLDIFLRLFGSKEDVSYVLDNYFNMNKDKLDINKLQTLQELLEFEKNKIEEILGDDASINDDLDAEVNEMFNALFDPTDSTILNNDANLFLELYMYLILSYFNNGISSISEKTGYFKGSVGLNDQVTTRISELLLLLADKLSNNVTSSEINVNANIAGVYGGGFENIIWNNKEYSYKNINANLYINPANEGELITIKITTDNPSTYDLEFIIHDINGEVGTCFIYGGQQQGILQLKTRVDDVYVNIESKTLYIHDVQGTDSELVNYDSNSVVIDITDTIQKTILTFNRDLTNYKEIYNLRIKTNKIEDGILSGNVTLIDPSGIEIPFMEPIKVVLSCYYNFNEELITVDIPSSSSEGTFSFTITGTDDVYINDELVILTLKSIQGFEFNYSADSKQLKLPFLDSLDDTICKMNIQSYDNLNNSTTYKITLSNPPLTPFHFVFSSGEKVTFDVGETEKYETLQTIPDPYRRTVDPVNSVGGSFENVVFDVTGMDIENRLTLSISDVQEGNQTVFIVRSSEFCMSDITVPIIDDSGTTLCNVTINSGSNVGETFITQSVDTNIQDAQDYTVKIGDVISGNSDFNYVSDSSYKTYTIYDNIDTVYWSTNIDFVSNTVIVETTQSADSASYLIELGLSTADLITKFSILSTNSEGVTTNIGYFDLPGNQTSTSVAIDPSIIYNNIQIVCLNTPFEHFQKVSDIYLVIEPYVFPEDYNQALNIPRFKYKYRYEYNLNLSNEPETPMTIFLKDQFGNTKEIVMDTIETTVIETNIDPQLLPEYEITSTNGGNFEFLEIQGLPQSIYYMGVDLTLTSNGEIYENDSILYIVAVNKVLAEDLWVQLNNGEELIIPAGRLSATVQSKKLSINETFSNDTYINTTVVTNYIKGINKANINILNGYSNPINTLIHDDYTTTKLELSYMESESTVTYSVQISDYPISPVNVLLDNGVLLTVPTGNKYFQDTVPKGNLTSITTINDTLEKLLPTKKGKYFLITKLIDQFFYKFNEYKTYQNELNELDENRLQKIVEEIKLNDEAFHESWTLGSFTTEDDNSAISYLQTTLIPTINSSMSDYKNSMKEQARLKTIMEYLNDFVKPKLQSTIQDLTEYSYNIDNRLNQVNSELSKLKTNLTKYETLSVNDTNYSIDLYKISEYKRKIYNYNYIHLQIQDKNKELDQLSKDYQNTSQSKNYNMYSQTFSKELDDFYKDEMLQIEYNIKKIKSLLVQYLGEFNRLRIEMGLEPASMGTSYDPGPYLQTSLIFYRT